MDDHDKYVKLYAYKTAGKCSRFWRAGARDGQVHEL